MANEIPDFDEFPSDAVWLKQPGETALSYEAFCKFRDLGPRRSLRQATKAAYDLDELPSNNSSKLWVVKKWSAKFDWVERAWAYDAHIDRMSRIEQVETAKLMVRRHAAVATVAIAKAGERINAINPAQLTPREAAALLDLGVKIERTARGQVSEFTETADQEAAERTFKEAIASNPALALAARDLARAMSGLPSSVAAAVDSDPDSEDEE